MGFHVLHTGEEDIHTIFGLKRINPTDIGKTHRLRLTVKEKFQQYMKTMVLKTRPDRTGRSNRSRFQSCPANLTGKPLNRNWTVWTNAIIWEGILIAHAKKVSTMRPYKEWGHHGSWSEKGKKRIFLRRIMHIIQHSCCPWKRICSIHKEELWDSLKDPGTWFKKGQEGTFWRGGRRSWDFFHWFREDKENWCSLVFRGFWRGRRAWSQALGVKIAQVCFPLFSVFLLTFYSSSFSGCFWTFFLIVWCGH